MANHSIDELCSSFIGPTGSERKGLFELTLEEVLLILTF